ncbi:hypothetical protein HanPI659440_Chr08g0304441 [Helianthus annuus]|nr:hypothetical protein HanPI659440_Chr08g0304441 [Helianthus annuus]
MCPSHIGARMKAWEDSKLIKGVQGFGFKVPQPKINLKCLVFLSFLVLLS